VAGEPGLYGVQVLVLNAEAAAERIDGQVAVIVGRIGVLERLEIDLEVGLLLRAAGEDQEQAVGRHGERRRAGVKLKLSKRVGIAVKGDEGGLIDSLSDARREDGRLEGLGGREGRGKDAESERKGDEDKRAETLEELNHDDTLMSSGRILFKRTKDDGMKPKTEIAQSLSDERRGAWRVGSWCVDATANPIDKMGWMGHSLKP